MIETRPATRALMACLGEHSRFRLVQALMEGPRCVTDLAAEVGLSQSCTTRHLQALDRRHVVRGTRDGKRVLYRIRDDQPDLRPLLVWALKERAATLVTARPGGGRTVPQAGRPGPAPARVPSKPAALEARETRPSPALELEPPRGGPRRGGDLEDFLL